MTFIASLPLPFARVVTSRRVVAILQANLEASSASEIALWRAREAVAFAADQAIRAQHITLGESKRQDAVSCALAIARRALVSASDANGKSSESLRMLEMQLEASSASRLAFRCARGAIEFAGKQATLVYGLVRVELDRTKAISLVLAAMRNATTCASLANGCIFFFVSVCVSVRRFVSPLLVVVRLFSAFSSTVDGQASTPPLSS